MRILDLIRSEEKEAMASALQVVHLKQRNNQYEYMHQ